MDDLLESHVTGYGTPLSTDDVLEDDIVDILRGELVEIQAMNDALQARAEAAEQRIIEQQAMINILSAPPPPLEPIVKQYERDYAELQKAYFASLDRVAELAAQLAAQADLINTAGLDIADTSAMVAYTHPYP